MEIVTANTLILPVKGTWNKWLSDPSHLTNQMVGRREHGVEREAGHISVAELASWKHEDWRKETPLTTRIWVNLTSGKSQTLFRTSSLPSLSLSALLFCARGPQSLLHSQNAAT